MAKVLLIDDEPDIRRIARLLLEPYGHEVILGEDGLRGLGMAQHQRPDVIVLDLMMPGIDGWGVLEHLKKTADPPPVVIVTARTDYGTFARGVREGGTAFVCKPFRFHELVATCQRLLMPGVLQGSSASGAERRCDPRRTLMVEVKVLSRERAPIALGELVNLGPGGAQVDLGVPLDLGDAVRVAFHIPGGENALSIEGQVRWRAEAPRGFAHGLKFQSLTPDEERQLGELLRPQA